MYTPIRIVPSRLLAALSAVAGRPSRLRVEVALLGELSEQLLSDIGVTRGMLMAGPAGPVTAALRT